MRALKRKNGRSRMTDAVARKGISRAILTLLTLYALAMIVPDFARIVWPLGAFGLATNADGLIYEIQGPFATEDASPASRAELHVGDRLDLRAMRCIPVDTELCASNLALWGGVGYVLPGRPATLKLEANGDRPAREVKLVAAPRPRSVAVDLMLALTQIAGVLVVLGAAWLVWSRPGPMTWGFFAYVMYFNPGQSFQFAAWLQQWPPALLAQDVASGVFQAAGYAGLLLFALRAPVDRIEGRWRLAQRALPAAAILFLAVEAASLGSLFGFPTEFAMRAALLIGFAVSVAAIAILIARRGDLSPRDYQRMRWVIWGCLIGLPANVDCGTLAGDLPAARLVRGRRADRRRRGLLLPDQRRPLPVRRRGGAAPDGGQRLGSAAPRDRPRAHPQPASVLHSRGTEHGQRMDRPAGVGVGAGRLGSGLPDLPPARMDDRASRLVVRSRLPQGRAAPRRGGSRHPARGETLPTSSV